MRFLSILISTTHAIIVLASGCGEPIAISSYLSANASAPVLEAFVSFSIELAFFPDFAGMFHTDFVALLLSDDQQQVTCLHQISFLIIS